MNIVVLRRKKGCTGLVTLCHRKLAMLTVGFFVVMPALLLYAGYKLGVSHMQANPDDLTLVMQSELETQRLQLSEVTQKTEENLNALALRLGKLQAHVIRLDALGQRLTNMAKLDNGEFDFNNPPAQGGPEAQVGSALQIPDFLNALNDLSAQLEDRSKQLSVLETLMMNRKLQAEVMPTCICHWFFLRVNWAPMWSPWPPVWSSSQAKNQVTATWWKSITAMAM